MTQALLSDQPIYAKAYGSRLVVQVIADNFELSPMWAGQGYTHRTIIDFGGVVTWWPARDVEQAISVADTWYAHYKAKINERQRRKVKIKSHGE